MGGCIHHGAVAGVPVGVERAMRQVAAVHHRLALVFGQRFLLPADAQNFGGNGVGQNLALDFANAGGWSGARKLSHDDLLAGLPLAAAHDCVKAHFKGLVFC